MSNFNELNNPPYLQRRVFIPRRGRRSYFLTLKTNCFGESIYTSLSHPNYTDSYAQQLEAISFVWINGLVLRTVLLGGWRG